MGGNIVNMTHPLLPRKTPSTLVRHRQHPTNNSTCPLPLPQPSESTAYAKESIEIFIICLHGLDLICQNTTKLLGYQSYTNTKSLRHIIQNRNLATVMISTQLMGKPSGFMPQYYYLGGLEYSLHCSAQTAM